MNILYGVQATGNGHISRSREVVKALRARGHRVQTLFSGRDRDDLWDVEDFVPYEWRRGLTFVTCRGRVNYLATAARLRLFRLYRDVRECEAGRYDLVVTDYEPVTARVARLRGLPCLGIGHQYAFGYGAVPRAPGNPLARWVLRSFAPAGVPLGLHWHHFGAPILPPIVPPLPETLPPPEPDKILVYLSFENLTEVCRVLAKITDAQFFIYTAVPAPEDRGNLHLRPYSRRGFLADLHSSSGIIANAGFELSSEALQAGKKILVKPLSGQMEQESNALAIALLNAGMVIRRLDPDQIRKWLASPQPEPAVFPDVAGLIADWIGRGDFSKVAELARQAWAATRLPGHFHNLAKSLPGSA